MTYREWMNRTCARFSMEEADAELVLVNQRGRIPDPDEEADPDTAKRALCAEIAAVIPLANVSEGGYSVSWNWEAVRFWYKQTCAELGITEHGAPRLRNRSNVW